MVDLIACECIATENVATQWKMTSGQVFCNLTNKITCEAKENLLTHQSSLFNEKDEEIANMLSLITWLASKLYKIEEKVKRHPTCTITDLVHMSTMVQTCMFNAMTTLPDLTRIYLYQSLSKRLNATCYCEICHRKRMRNWADPGSACRTDMGIKCGTNGWG
jgi:hypothetical protein